MGVSLPQRLSPLAPSTRKPWTGDECPAGLRRNLGFTESDPNSALFSRCNYCFKELNLKEKRKKKNTQQLHKELQVLRNH